ncbi:MAG: asparagine--tRNA ligase, partial [Clostridia bacterium]|nr:asparagine--tRNA ligase [Clostridia bacterium]
MKHIDIKDIKENKELIGKDVVVCGWVRTARDSKNMAFLEINDGSTLKHLQIVIEKQNVNVSNECLKLGAAVKVNGTVAQSMNNNNSVEINAKEVILLGSCPDDYPIQKKRHTLEYLRTIPHLRLRTNTFNAVFRVRSRLAASLHRFFQERNFVYVNTPLITGSDCEGAGEVFQVTTHGYAPEIKSEEEYNQTDFFGKKATLSVSGQLEGEVCATAFGKIYTFGPSFRAENSNTPRHVAEFWHIEPEVAFAELDDVLELAEDMFRYIVSDLLKTSREELEFFQAHFEPGLIEKLEKAIENDFGVITYTEAIDLLKKSGENFAYPVEWGCDLQTEHERYIVEKIFNKPVFVINYPRDIKAFYMKQNADGKTVAASDLLVPGVGEIIGGSEREADYDKLVAEMKKRNMDMSAYDNYIALRR